MLPTSLLTITGGILLFTIGQANAQEVIDLLGKIEHSTRLHVVSAYNPRVEPQVRCIRSNDEATLFCASAWDEDNKALHIDFDREQILVVAWGELRWAEGSAGSGVAIHLEQATIRDGTLRVKVRTVIPPGPGIDIAANRPGRTWYPSLFLRAPRTDRVEVDLIGARRRKPAADFRAIATKDLEVRIAPDASPSRELVSFVERQETVAAETPKTGLFERDHQTVLEVAWGELGSGAYGLELVGMLVDKGIARLTVRADNRLIYVYSGPGVHRPGLAVALPPVERVLLHIERVGMALPATESDFEAQTSKRLVVTVDRSAIRYKQ